MSRRARSAIAAVLDIGRLARGKPMPAKALAERHDLSPRQFEAVLQDLVRADILRGLRGPRGGYELARERRRITLGDIVRAADGRRRPEEEAAKRPAPAVALDTLIEPVVQSATAAFLARLDAVSVEELCRNADTPKLDAGLPGAPDYAI